MSTTAPAKTATDKVKVVPMRTGIVESDKRSKTRKVVVANLSTHPKYGKIMRSRTVLHVHDEKNESKTGDMVEVAECRPLSKTKRWTLVRIVQKGASMKFVGIEAPAVEKKD